MKSRTSVKAKFRSSPILGQPGTIIYVLSRQRIQRQLSTDYKIYPIEWDHNNGSIIVPQSGARVKTLKSITQRLKFDLFHLSSIITQLEKSNTSFTVDDIVAEFKQFKEKCSFFIYMQSVISRLHQLGKVATASNYQYTLNSFKKFRKDIDLHLNQLSADIIEEYEAWLKENGVKPNSSSFYMRNLRAVYNRAVADELTNDTKPFRKAYTGVVKTSKRAISIKDIKRIKDLDLSLTPPLEFVRDVFLFQFYAMGISFIDAAYLTSDNIIDNSLVYRRHKTNQEIVVPINNLMHKIIKK